MQASDQDALHFQTLNEGLSADLMTLKSELNQTRNSFYEQNQNHNKYLIEVYNILFCDKDAKQAVLDLLSRGAYEEWKQY